MSPELHQKPLKDLYAKPVTEQTYNTSGPIKFTERQMISRKPWRLKTVSSFSHITQWIRKAVLKRMYKCLFTVRYLKIQSSDSNRISKEAISNLQRHDDKQNGGRREKTDERRL